MDIETCRIWGEDYPAKGHTRPDPSQVIVSYSARADGGYIILGSASRRLDKLDDSEKARLTTWLIDQRLQGIQTPTVTDEIIQYTAQKHVLPTYERAYRLLRFMAGNTTSAAEFLSFYEYGDQKIPTDEMGFSIYPESPTNPTLFSAMAWSESTSVDEVSYFHDYLEEVGWVRESFPNSRRYRVTVDGHNHIAEQTSNPDDSQVFVAMWFDDSVVEVYEEGILPAIEECGYVAKRIDRDHSVDKIDDAIIAEIRRSRFLVADFTHGEKGARGGVYYEAGFAHGIGIPVIFTCHRSMIDEIHFDTRQYAHVLWDSADELRRGLRDRILARIGKTPK